MNKMNKYQRAKRRQLAATWTNTNLQTLINVSAGSGQSQNATNLHD